MSFLVIYVNNSESTSTSFSSQSDFIFVEIFQGQRIKFPNFIKEKKNNTKPHHTILATSNAAQLQPLVTSWCPWHKAGQTCADNSSDCLASLIQHSWWMLCCWQHRSMASSSGHPLLPSEINSWCNKDSIMRFKNSRLMFPSGKLMGGLKFTERFEMEGRRENNW